MPDDRGTSLVMAVLQAVAAPSPKHGYERPNVGKYTHSEIDSAVDQLRRAGLVIGHEIPSGLGDNPRHWAPSVLTRQGRRLLDQLYADADAKEFDGRSASEIIAAIGAQAIGKA
jgi:hypothetical protein